MKTCIRCVVPETLPGSGLENDDVCRFCREDNTSGDREKIRSDVEDTIRSVIGAGPSYDIVLAFSGGKDSTYTLQYLRKTFDARILAITVDNGFVAETALENCRNVPSALGVDHIFFKPNPKALFDIYNRSLSDDVHSPMALTRASAICNSCIQVINTQIVNFAVNYKVPIVAGGYIGGQVPTNTGLIKQNLKVTAVTRQGFMQKLESVFDAEALRLFRLNAHSSQSELLVVNPMIYLCLSEEEILAEISKLGWKKPANTGKSSTNCLLNDYGIAQHVDKHNFHPYVLETAHLVRQGKMDRSKALELMQAKFEPKQFVEIERKLKAYQ